MWPVLVKWLRWIGSTENTELTEWIIKLYICGRRVRYGFCHLVPSSIFIQIHTLDKFFQSIPDIRIFSEDTLQAHTMSCCLLPFYNKTKLLSFSSRTRNKYVRMAIRNIITHPRPYFASGLAKLSVNFGYCWVITFLIKYGWNYLAMSKLMFCNLTKTDPGLFWLVFCLIAHPCFY